MLTTLSGDVVTHSWLLAMCWRQGCHAWYCYVSSGEFAFSSNSQIDQRPLCSPTSCMCSPLLKWCLNVFFGGGLTCGMLLELNDSSTSVSFVVNGIRYSAHGFPIGTWAHMVAGLKNHSLGWATGSLTQQEWQKWCIWLILKYWLWIIVLHQVHGPTSYTVLLNLLIEYRSECGRKPRTGRWPRRQSTKLLGKPKCVLVKSVSIHTLTNFSWWSNVIAIAYSN